MAHGSYRLAHGPATGTPPESAPIERDGVKAWVVGSDASALQTVADAPHLSSASCPLLREISIVDEQGRQRPLSIPEERPLTVYLDGRELVTLMTLGARPEFLVAGYLRNQRLIDEVRELESIRIEWRNDAAEASASAAAGGSAAVTLRSGPERGAAGAGAGGMACGVGSVLSALLMPGGLGAAAGRAPARASEIARVSQTTRVSQSTLLSILDTMRRHDDIHRTAGSVHSCALFHNANLLASIEDVSRHNGIDTITGWMALHGVIGTDKILFTTGRLTGEMVMKAAHNGISIVVSRNGVTAMGYEAAAVLKMTLFGRAANRRFYCYVGAERFDAATP